jgi:hypothetical protein
MDTFQKYDDIIYIKFKINNPFFLKKKSIKVTFELLIVLYDFPLSAC